MKRMVEMKEYVHRKRLANMILDYLVEEGAHCLSAGITEIIMTFETEEEE